MRHCATHFGTDNNALINSPSGSKMAPFHDLVSSMDLP